MRDMESSISLGPVRLVSDSMQACEELMLHGQAQFLLCHHHTAAPVRFEAGTQFQSALVGSDALVPFVAPGANGEPKWRFDEANVDTIPYLAYSEESGQPHRSMRSTTSCAFKTSRLCSPRSLQRR